MADEENPQFPLPNGSEGSNPGGAGDPPSGPLTGIDAPGAPGAANLISINLEEEMRRSYLDYSMSVIIGRALPEVRDGLKPVHRRVLYGMHDMGLQPNKKYTKCAKVVGHVMGNYHPHGDASIYDTMVRMAQPFSLRYPLVDGQGNFGSIDGDPPAAMRYTESKMAKIAGEMLADIDMETVDFVPNYDESTFEPAVLPARIPNLIVNGSNGIAVGMATNIPPHNLTEVLNATIALVQNPEGGLAAVLEHVQGPDFPTGGFIYGKSGIANAYRTGRGRFLMRAKVGMENISGGRQAIIVTEIPYQVNKSKLIERIAELVHEKVVDDISDVRDESDRDGMRIVIELKRGVESQIVLNQLYKHSQMQESFSMIFLAVANNQPRELPLDVAIQHFIEHRVDVVRRRTAFQLRKAREREHILLGYQIALDHLDTVIRVIRGSSSRADARANLFEYFAGRTITVRGNTIDGVTLDPAKYLSEGTESVAPAVLLPATLTLSFRQIDAILELQLYRLTQISIDELLNELRLVRGNIAEFEAILASEPKLRSVIVKELETVRDQYGDARRTHILDETAELQLEDLIADEQVAVTVSHSQYLKRTPISTYRQQRRGGVGRIGMKTREEDFVQQLIVNSTHAYLLCFTNTGRMYWLKIYEIPDVGAAGKGKSMASLLNLQPGEQVRNILAVRNLEEEGKYIFFATRKGTVKKTPLKDFSNVQSRGIIAIGIDDDDELIGVSITDGKQIVFLATHEGLAIRFGEENVRSMGRPAYGVRGIDLQTKDYVVGLAVTPAERTTGTDGANTASLILTVTSNGFGKRTDVDAYRLQTRGGKGVINLKTSTKNGKVNAIQLVDETSELMVISQYGKIIRIDTKQIRAAGRSTQGVKLLNLDAEDKVAAAVVIPPEELKDDASPLLQ